MHQASIAFAANSLRMCLMIVVQVYALDARHTGVCASCSRHRAFARSHCHLYDDIFDTIVAQIEVS
jgi:hypothetical protein